MVRMGAKPSRGEVELSLIVSECTSVCICVHVSLPSEFLDLDSYLCVCACLIKNQTRSNEERREIGTRASWALQQLTRANVSTTRALDNERVVPIDKNGLLDVVGHVCIFWNNKSWYSFKH